MANLHISTLPPCPGRILVIGDVHGCVEELETLIEAFSPGENDRIIAVGDLINRGPDSRATLELARERKIVSVLGNHEQRLLQAWKAGNPDLLKSKDLATFNALQEADWQWIENWPHVIRIPSRNLLITHGGFAPGIPWQEQDPGMVTWIQVLDNKGVPRKRSDAPNGKPWANQWTGPEHVIYGHTPRPHPLRHPLATGLDTGCVYGYELTGLSLPDWDFYRAHARRRYVDD